MYKNGKRELLRIVLRIVENCWQKRNPLKIECRNFRETGELCYAILYCFENPSIKFVPVTGRLQLHVVAVVCDNGKLDAFLMIKRKSVVKFRISTTKHHSITLSFFASIPLFRERLRLSPTKCGRL